MRYIKVNKIVCCGFLLFLLKGLLAIITFTTLSINYNLIAPLGYIAFLLPFFLFISRAEFSSYLELSLFSLPVVAIILRDEVLFYITFLFFVSPVLIRYLSKDNFVLTSTSFFFRVVIIYSVIESLAVYILGVSKSEMLGFMSGAYGKAINLSDERASYFFGYRSAGFVFNLLIHPMLLVVSASYYIGKGFYHKTVANFILSFLGCSLVILSLSGTALASMMLVFIFQFFLMIKRGSYSSIILFLIILFFIALLISGLDYSAVSRVSDNLNDDDYVHVFTSIGPPPEAFLGYLFFGVWDSVLPGMSSHVDIYKLIFSCGIFALIYWLVKTEIVKQVFSLLFGRIKITPMMSAYISCIIAWAGCIFHHYMSITPIGILVFVLACASFRRVYYSSLLGLPEKVDKF